MLVLPVMTWRRFQVLLRCLSPQSATLTRMQSKQYIGGGKGEKTVSLDNPKAAEAAFMAAFATPKGAKPRRKRRAKSKGPAPTS